MGIFQGFLLITDYDDTLVDRQKRVPERSMEALRRFTAEGGRFTLASGRSLVALKSCLAGLPVNAPVIASNGVQIYDFAAEKLLYQAEMPENSPADFQRIFAEFPEVAVEICAGDQLYCVNPNEVTWEHLRITGQTAKTVELQDIPTPWLYAKFQHTTPYLRQVQTFLRQEFSDRYTAIFSHPNLLEVANGACGKGPAALRLGELLNIPKSRIFCAGDNENDLSMLRSAALGFTPAGSSQQALDTADVVVCNCDQGALADVVQYLETHVVPHPGD
jgi:hypothetical protein